MKALQLLLQHRFILLTYVLAAIVVSVQLVSLGHDHFFTEGGIGYTYYNNYTVFKESFFNLVNDRDLYILHLDKQWDLYKYSPTFALLMAPLAYLPDIIGLSLWNVLNATVLFLAIRSLPLGEEKQSYILLFVFIELVVSMQATQSNALLAGCIILANSHLQKGRPLWAALLLVFATFIKVYGLVGFCLFLFYPRKLQFILYSAMWTVIFVLLPLLVTSPGMLVAQYSSWAKMMAGDQSVSYGLSVMGWLHSWFGLGDIKNGVMLSGLALFLLPLTRVSLYRDGAYRLLFLCQMLVWVIIFNHKAESPTFIIAVTGIATWYFTRERVPWRTILLWLVFVGTSLTPTDLFPGDLRTNILLPYVVKAVPAIVMWLVMMYEIMAMRSSSPRPALMAES